MSTRHELHAQLVDILGSNYVYFQPPASVKMHFPAIVYSKETPKVVRASNALYRWNECFSVVVVSSDPDNTFARKICEKFPYSSAGKRYVASNLYHDPITIYI